MWIIKLFENFKNEYGICKLKCGGFFVINLLISEVENWLLNETNRSLAPLRRKAKDFVDEISEYLKSII